MPFVIGRPRTSRMTSDLLALDVFQFHREGALDAGAVTRCRWPHPAAPLDMIVKAEADHMVLTSPGSARCPCGLSGRPSTSADFVRGGRARPVRRDGVSCMCLKAARHAGNAVGLSYRSR